MKRRALSVLLGLMLLFSVLIIETGTVRAEGQNYLIVKTTVMADLGNTTGTVSKTYRLPSESSATAHTIEYRAEGTTVWFYLPVTSKYDVLYYLMRDAYYNKEYYKLYIEDIITNTLGTSLVSYDAFYHDLSGIGDIKGTAIYIRAYCPGTSSADSDTQEDTITLSSSSEIAVLLDDWFQRTDEARNNVQAKLDYGNDGTFEYDTGVYTSTQAKGLQFVTGTDATLYTYLHADDRGGDYEAAAVAASIFVLSDASVSNTNTNAVIVSFNVQSFSNIITFNLKDELTGESLTNVTVKEGDIILGTISDGESLELQKGTHTLTFEKSGYWSKTITLDVQADTSVTVELYPSTAQVTFSLKDALTGESLTGVTIKENGTILGTISDGESLTLSTLANHTLTIEKSGYWSTTLTIEVLSDMNVSVELYPDSYVIIASYQVSKVYQYSQGVVTMSVQVMEGSGYGYSTKVSISGVEVTKVTWNGGVINKGDDGSYYLGDISSGELKIYFKAGDVLGSRSFRVTFTTYDALANMKSNEYTITYEALEPPFRVTLPLWKIGVNTVRVTDQSGVDRVISVILYDSQGTEVYSDSQSLLSYGAVDFNIPIDSLDSYLLEVRSNDGISLYFDVTASVPIVLKEDIITVSGSSGEVVVEISNSGNAVAYYKFIVEGTPIDNSTQPVEVSLAPGETKTVTVPFKLKSDLTLDTYEATIKALDASDNVVWSSTFIIKRSGFSLPLSLDSNSYLGGAVALVIVLGGIVIVKRRRRG